MMKHLMIRMKVLAILPGLLALILACSGSDRLPVEEASANEPDPGFAGWGKALGVNYNEQLQFVDFDELERTKTRWGRVFFDFFQLYDNPESLHSDQKVQNYLSLKNNGYQTILNIKWNFKGRSVSLPALNSPALEDYFSFLDRLLEKVWAQTDILVIGNEPFIETLTTERDQRLVDFYKAVAKAVEKFRETHPRHFVPVFVGAFNNLHDPAWRTTAVDQLMEFARSEPGIAGIDLHIHHASMDQMKSAFGYAADKIREDQKILVTEFSLMKHWKAQLNEPVPESFALQYQLKKDLKNYQYIDFALKNSRSATEWYSFLQASEWFESRKHYLEEAFSLLSGEPRFLIATYAIRQSFPFDRDFTPAADPWVLNGIFANRTVEPDPLTGKKQFNYSFIDDFIAIQNKFRAQRE